MTEVIGLRNSCKPRPLGELKDNHIFFDEDSNKVISERQPNDTITDTRRRTKHTFKRMKEVRESLRQAALINIVAAVNGNDSEHQVEKKPAPRLSDSLNNTMAVISNLVLNKDRAISIPKRQGFLENQQHLTTNKTLLVTNGLDNSTADIQDDSNSSFNNRQRNISLSRTRTCINENKVQFAFPTKSKNAIEKSNDTTESKSADATRRGLRELASRRKSGRPKIYPRKLSSLSKSDPRVPSNISKCDAVDIMDSGANTTYVQMSTPIVSSIDTSVDKPLSAAFKTYRAKSLPAIFPIKRKKNITLLETNLSTTDANSKTHKMATPFKSQTLKAFYDKDGIMGQLSTEDNDSNTSTPPIQQHLYTVPPTSAKSIMRQESSTNNSMISKQPTLNGLPDKSIILQRDSNITLEGRSVVSEHISNSLQNAALSYTKGRKLNLAAPQLVLPEPEKIDFVQEIDKQFEELQKRISKKISTWSKKRGLQSANDTIEDDQHIAVSGFNLSNGNVRVVSSVSSSQSRATTSSMRGHKKVKFIEDENSKKIERSTSNYQNWDYSDVSSIQATGRANTFFQPTKPMSAQELIFLKRKLLPGQQLPNKNQQSKFNSNSMKISGMTSRNTLQQNTNSTSLEARSVRSDSYSDIHGYADKYSYRDPDVTDRTSTQVPKSYGASSFYPDNNYFLYDDCSDIDDDDPLDEDYDFDDASLDDSAYRMVKAIDLGTLSGYQHRKFRKPQTKETTATHFVKVKMK